MKLKLLLLFFILLAYARIYSQNLFLHEYGIAEGLPEQEVIWLDIDHLGNLWYATTNYFGYYNGYKFKYWHTRDLGHMHIPLAAIYTDSVSYFRFSPGTFKKFRSNCFLDYSIELADESAMRQINIGIPVADNVLVLQSKEDFHIDTIVLPPEVLSKQPLTLAKTYDSKLLLTAKENNEIQRLIWDGSQFSIREVQPVASSKGGQIQLVNGYYEIKSNEGDLIRSFDSRVVNSFRAVKQIFSEAIYFSFNKGDRRYYYEVSSNEIIFLGTTSVFGVVKLVCDHSGNIWVASHSGLYRINTKIWHFSPSNSPGMVGSLHLIQEDADGNMIFGGYQEGLCAYDGSKFNSISLPHRYDRGILPGSLLQGDTIFSFTSRHCELLEIKKGKILNSKVVKSGTSIRNGYMIVPISRGRYALGLNKLGLGITPSLGNFCDSTQLISKSKGLLLDNVLTIAEDAKRRLWCGRASQGIAVYDQERDTAHSWLVTKDLPNSFGTMSSLIDTNGSLWLGSSHGLKCIKDIQNFDIANESPFDKAIGIELNNGESEVVASIAETKEYLVFGTTASLNFLNKNEFYQSGRSVVYQILYGQTLPGAGTDQNIIKVDKKGFLWVGTNDGAVRLELNNLPIDTVQSRILFSNIIAGQEEASVRNSEIVLPHHNRSFSLEIEVQGNPMLDNSIRFASSLVSAGGDTLIYEQHMDEPLLKRQFLQPGSYLYSVFGYKNGKLIDQISLNVDVPKRLFEQAVFWIALFGILLFAIASVIYHQIKRKQEEVQSKLQIASLTQSRDQARLQAIISSFNPHFINNSLHWIQSKYTEDEETVRIIGRLSENIHHIFKYTKDGTATHTIREELKLVENYVAIQQVRFGNSFSYESPSEEIVNRFSSFSIPLMQIQIHVENAIEHGIRNRRDSSFVKVVMAFDKEHIVVKIIDDGIGRYKNIKSRSHGSQAGVKMLQEIHELYNVFNQVKLFQKYDDLVFDDHGTQVVVRIPKLFNQNIYDFSSRS